MLNKPDTILVDIDGTIADGSWRFDKRPVAAKMNDTKAWDEFNLAAGGDSRLEDVVALVDNMFYMGFNVVFMTGRNEIAREVTYQWLSETFDWFEEYCADIGSKVTLIHRERSDSGTPVQCKTALLNRVLNKYNLLFALDDDPSICKAFRKMGVQTYQVRDWQGENK